MKLLVACVSAVLLSGPGLASAQTSTKPTAKDPLRENAIKRCKENRGTDCESEEGLREWLLQEQPITAEQQQAAAASRRHREKCAQTKGKAFGC